MMNIDEEGADTLEEILNSISASSHNSSPKELSLSHDLPHKATQILKDHGASRVGLYSSFSGNLAHGIFEANSQGFPSDLTSPFQTLKTMIAPELAVEPPTPHESVFHFGDRSQSNHGIQKSQPRLESPLKASLSFQNPRGIFHSSSTDTFSSYPNNSPGAFRAPYSLPHSFYGDHAPGLYSKGVGVPIARSNVKSHPEATSAARKFYRHQRDLSGTSSTASSLSGPPYDFCPAIDPSALQPPLRKLQTETSLGPNEVNHIISPFINQVLEHGPDGTMTGRYSRPLTSTGRPSHARKTPPGHVKRPRNAFILFRSHACSSNLIPPAVEKDHRQISRIVSHMWKSLPPNEKVKWEREAEAEKELHRKLHPDYRYKPIYRKENSGKKASSGLGSSAVKKKSNCPKKSKGANHDNTECISKDSENRVSVNQKSSHQLQQERDEELRCEAVAKVLMETKLTGITLDEGEMEERVSAQVRRFKESDANQSIIKSQSQAHGKSDQATFPPVQNTDSNAVSITETEKPKSKILAPLQSRRKSVLSRSNSAPPPPSPLRTMHVREVVYNPKARGSRELSPDFPKLRLMTAEEDMSQENVPSQPDHISHPTLFLGSYHSQLPGENTYNPFAALSTRNLSYHHFQCDSTPSQELEQLFHSPDFAFADGNYFRSQQNDISHSLFNSQVGEQDEHPIFNGFYAETKCRYPKDPPDQRHWENVFYQNGQYPSELCDPLTKLAEDPKSVQFLETSRPNADDKQTDDPVAGEGSKLNQNGMENDFLIDLGIAPNARRPSLNVFTLSTRRKSSVTMASIESSNPQLIEAVELAKRNMALFSDQKEKWCSSMDEPGKRRQSVVLSGLGEFPIMDLPRELSESNQEKTIADVRMECDENQENPAGSTPHPVPTSNFTPQGSASGAFANFTHPFAASSENYTGSATNPPGSLTENDYRAQNHFEDTPSAQYANMDCDHAPKGPQVSDEIRGSLPGLTFESGIGQDGQTYLFLTKEQAEAEGLIAQILDAGFGVTYETDIPLGET